MPSGPLKLSLTRVFWWNKSAPVGAPGHPVFVPPYQDRGRFDLPGTEAVRYLAESRAHAIAEVLQHLRGRTIRRSSLVAYGGTSQLASVDVIVELPDADLLPDLCDTNVLARCGIMRVDQLMSKQRPRSQELAKKIYDEGVAGGPKEVAGFRVWSALNGDWHAVVIFADRVAKLGSVVFGAPVVVEIDDPDLRLVAREDLMNFEVVRA
jgi:RES domain-containing protein